MTSLPQSAVAALNVTSRANAATRAACLRCLQLSVELGVFGYACRPIFSRSPTNGKGKSCSPKVLNHPEMSRRDFRKVLSGSFRGGLAGLELAGYAGPRSVTFFGQLRRPPRQRKFSTKPKSLPSGLVWVYSTHFLSGETLNPTSHFPT